MTLGQLRDLAVVVGFPDPDLAAAIAMAESSGNPLAVNLGTPANPEHSVGLWQINVLAHPEFDPVSLGDPLTNAHAAMTLSHGGANWAPWSTFTTTDPSRSYKRFMPTGVS